MELKKQFLRVQTMTTNDTVIRCSSTLYDVVTVIISIGDMVTDIVVLISFYEEDRIIFFIISSIILCVAQLAYSVAFMWKYDVLYSIYDRFNSIGDITKAIFSIAFFLILLPFGSIIPIIMYLTDDQTSCFTRRFEEITGLFTKYTTITNNATHSVCYQLHTYKLHTILNNKKKCCS